MRDRHRYARGRVAILPIEADKTRDDELYQRLIPLADRLYGERPAALAGEAAKQEQNNGL